MSTRELYIGGGPAYNYPGMAMFPRAAFSATDPNMLALTTSSQNGVTRVLDFEWDDSLKQYVAAQATAGTPIAASDILGIALLPPNVLFLGIYVSVSRPQAGVVLTPSTRNGELTFPAINCGAIQLGQFAAPDATSWVTGGPGAEVESVTLTAAGSGYTTAPTVAFSGGGGTGAAATANLVGAGLSGISVANGGTLYTSPTVAITGGGGSGATATATVSSGVITAFTVTAAGTGYTSPPTVTVSDSTGSGAHGVAAVTASAVASVTVINPGSGYTSAPTVAFSGGGGTAAAGTAVLSAASQTAGISGATFNNAPDILDLTVTALPVTNFGNLRVTIAPKLMSFPVGQH